VRSPFFLGLVHAVLDGVLQGGTEQVTAGVEGMGFAGVEDVAIGGDLGQRVNSGRLDFC
jgi:hypothetical protein